MALLFLRLKKLLKVLRSPKMVIALVKYRVLAATEHEAVLRDPYLTIIDIGANRGQFALAARAYSDSTIVSFEPLPAPAAAYKRIFKRDQNITLYNVAIGHSVSRSLFYVSKTDDSSSLFEIGEEQTSLFPESRLSETVEVDVYPLGHFLKPEDIIRPSLLKLDVQGAELAALRGSLDLINCFDTIYCECSFRSLYVGQSLAFEVVQFLSEHDFYLDGVYNNYYDAKGICVQADFLFKRKNNMPY